MWRGQWPGMAFAGVHTCGYTYVCVYEKILVASPHPPGGVVPDDGELELVAHARLARLLHGQREGVVHAVLWDDGGGGFGGVRVECVR